MAALEQSLEDFQKQQKDLEDEVELCNNKLSRAEQILKGLGGEKSRWTDAAISLRNSYPSLTGTFRILTIGFLILF